MSTSSGTATSYLDLLSKLRTFLTTDSALVSAGQNWTELATNSTPYTTGQPGTNDTVDFETYLKAPGLSGTESIYINIRAYHYTASDYYNWELRGALGYNSSAAFIAQPGICPSSFAYLWNSSIPYWFVANGQRVIVIAKVSTIYETLYLGKMLPYGTPGQYPYPLVISGSGFDSDRRFSDASYYHQAFFDPVNMQVCDPANAWQLFQNYNQGGSPMVGGNNTWPYLYYQYDRPVWMSANLDGSYEVFPIRLEQNVPSINMLGELDGVAFVTGYANGSENTISDGTNTWMVVQNTFRTSADNYAAIKMA